MNVELHWLKQHKNQYRVEKKGGFRGFTHRSLIFPLQRNLSIDLGCKSIDWFLYDRNINLKCVKVLHGILLFR